MGSAGFMYNPFNIQFNMLYFGTLDGERRFKGWKDLFFCLLRRVSLICREGRLKRCESACLLQCFSLRTSSRAKSSRGMYSKQPAGKLFSCLVTFPETGLAYSDSTGNIV